MAQPAVGHDYLQGEDKNIALHLDHVAENHHATLQLAAMTLWL